MKQQFFTKARASDQPDGPFSASQLSSRAREGTLDKDHLVSVDNQKWVSASKVKGLKFVEPSEEEQVDLTGAADLEYGLAPVETPSNPKHRPAVQSHRLSHAAGGLQSSMMVAPRSIAPASMRVPNPRAASLMGIAVGMVLLALVFIWYLATLSLEGTFLTTMLFFVGMACSFAVMFIIPACCFTRIDLTTGGQGHVNCVVRSYFLFIRFRTAETVVTTNDQIVLKVRTIAASEDEGQAMVYVTMAICFVVGFIPGIVFWHYWYNLRAVDTSSAIVRLILYTGHHNGVPIILFTRKVPDYFGTRVGAPMEVDKIKNMFHKMVLVPVIIDEP